MGEYPVLSKAMRVGEQVVQVLENLDRLDALYLDIGSSTHKVLGLLGTTFLLISRRAAAAAGDLDRGVVVLAYGLNDGEEFYVYRVEATATLARELSSAEIAR